MTKKNRDYRTWCRKVKSDYKAYLDTIMKALDEGKEGIILLKRRGKIEE
jgi:hypothetical protein